MTLLEQTITNILAKYDLEGLIKAGAPEMSYRHEAEEIAACLSMQRSVEETALTVKRVFIDYFCTYTDKTGEKHVTADNYPAGHFAEAAKDIWALRTPADSGT